MSLVFENVSCCFKEHKLLEDISFTARSGQIIALLGPNGAGKSTLLELAGGLKTPSTGKIRLNNIDLETILPHRLAAQRALLAQESPMTAAFSTTELLGLAFQSLQHPLSKREKGQSLTRCLASVGLESKKNQNVQTLSGGERQRAHLARILLQLEINRQAESQLLLLDEPLSAQDPAQHLLIFSLIRRHTRKGGTAMVILHDINWASAFADHIILLQHGRIYAQGPPKCVLTNATLGPLFGVPSFFVKHHKQTNRPYLIPHDMISSLS